VLNTCISKNVDTIYIVIIDIFMYCVIKCSKVQDKPDVYNKSPGWSHTQSIAKMTFNREGKVKLLILIST
jgi:hypothetical protein